MPRYSANLSILFPELPFIERFAAARRAGFQAVEFWFPYDHAIAELKSVIDGEGLSVVGLNTAPGNMQAGEFGLGGLPGREEEFRAHFERALDYAQGLGVPNIHVLSGHIDSNGEAACIATYLLNLERALGQIDGTGLTLLIEPLNHRDRPGYLVGTSERAADIVGRFAIPQLKMMFDIYHVQVAEGDIVSRLRRFLPIIGHIQIASVPDRSEPDRGELDYREILAEIDRLGWAGWVGAEYKPRAKTEDGLGWIGALSEAR